MPGLGIGVSDGFQIMGLIVGLIMGLAALSVFEMTNAEMGRLACAAHVLSERGPVRKFSRLRHRAGTSPHHGGGQDQPGSGVR
ncbi:hypothetical protein [Xanthobacter autotrophicus]|uniref:hypothetical protein n=1 Tax=Xanthobacter autotrophicus TaxID=280 RepID=UPI00372A4282